ncbi:nucleoside hydrolase [Bradyrhizobium sp. AUGA SZCCT0160]|nr:nucleoside hydrolase [Bradyrhizobium sp. AUGA SZCCT0160]MBR1192145.1 nucleoside hydrolase [Bradyrhizobium sp. AUGA SZCCT0160]
MLINEPEINLSAVLIDCDPGWDDALALVLLLAKIGGPNVIGVTTVYGNGTLSQSTENARRLTAYCGKPSLKVYSGSESIDVTMEWKTSFSRATEFNPAEFTRHGAIESGQCRRFHPVSREPVWTVFDDPCDRPADEHRQSCSAEPGRYEEGRPSLSRWWSIQDRRVQFSQRPKSRRLNDQFVFEHNSYSVGNMRAGEESARFPGRPEG